MGSVIWFAVGLAGGWAARGLGDSSQGAGVELLEIALHARRRLGRWAATQREHLDDMLAEAKSRIAHGGSSTDGKSRPGEKHTDETNERAKRAQA